MEMGHRRPAFFAAAAVLGSLASAPHAQAVNAGCTAEGADALATSMVAEQSTLVDAAFTAAPAGCLGVTHMVQPDGGINGPYPSIGNDFAALSSGTAARPSDPGYAPPGNSQPPPGGTDLGGTPVNGTASDLSTLRVDLDAPTSCLAFDFWFFTVEEPGSYNDAFFAELGASDWTADSDPEGPHDYAPGNFAVDASGNQTSVNTAVFDATATERPTQYPRGTRMLTATGPVKRGPVTLFLSIFDGSDGKNDSVAFVDNLRFLAAPECPFLRFDYGDAPDPSFPTLFSGGARHAQTDLRLGRKFDAEVNGKPSRRADGDDGRNRKRDDEDGVKFTSPIVPAQQADVSVRASNSGKLDAWLDFDRDRAWSEGDERIFASQPLSPGRNDLHFAVPATASVGKAFARFRLSLAGGLAPTGLAPTGEVEDYRVAIGSP